MKLKDLEYSYNMKYINGYVTTGTGLLSICGNVSFMIEKSITGFVGSIVYDNGDIIPIVSSPNESVVKFILQDKYERMVSSELAKVMV